MFDNQASTSRSRDTRRPIEFEFENHRVRVFTDGGEGWFAAKDVCEVLEQHDLGKAVSRLDDDEKCMVHVLTAAGGCEIVPIINESGLYRLIFASENPQAKPFRRWVPREMLPQIRETGWSRGHFSTVL
jgi:prophage antirepressor-like protein